jgi:hypothetical protein
MKEQEKIIACVFEKAGYWGVGVTHPDAEASLLHNPEIYIPHDFIEETEHNKRRKMLTDMGRLIGLDEAWKIAEHTGKMHETLEEFLENYMKAFGKDREHAVLGITSTDFEDALDETYDPKKAMAFAGLHNHLNKHVLLQQYPKSMADIWAARQQGD